MTAPPGQVFELAGSQRLSYADIAATLARVSGAPVRYQNLSESEYAGALVQAGLPEPVATMFAATDTGVAAGALLSDSTDLADVLQRPLVPFEQAIADGLNRQSQP